MIVTTNLTCITTSMRRSEALELIRQLAGALASTEGQETSTASASFTTPATVVIDGQDCPGVVRVLIGK